ncbi:sce7725 family protein [Chryseobacterium sp. PTM-20240506]|uniref:sce7725 family protein n=1 Tax=Chryseobacterium sp. PTM-20240506 TaxID=3400631 RepID=UPI00293C61DD|nr:sce7725 family protein [Elizabethkingia anophelis]MDV3596578.1 hypothetical protein [Elizabethkingia anophelis]
MYHPYIRGKQFELIGIREITPSILSANRDKISPIIEPVKDSSTFRKTLTELVNNNINFTVIVNPQYGTFKDTESILNSIQIALDNYTDFQIGVIFDGMINHTLMLSILNQYPSLAKYLTIVHQTIYDNIVDIIPQYEEIAEIKFNVVDFANTSKRYFRNFDRSTLVELDDYFGKQNKNSDYLNTPESFFSEEHLHYIEDGFVGFSDYLTIGNDYSESGFLPYAVAIHLSHPDSQNRIFVRHFVSNSNTDQSDVPGKFAEALDKLISWCDTSGYNSVAIPIFRDYHTTGHFPGLGTLKKLSLMNHIDLVLRLM